MKRVALILALLLPALAWAQVDRKFGGCTDDLLLCAGPGASVSLIEINLSDHTSRSGIIPGVGYGLTFWPTEWWNLGFSIFLAYEKKKEYDRINPIGMLAFAEYVRVGFGVERFFGEDESRHDTNLMLYIGFGIDAGATPGIAGVWE